MSAPRKGGPKNRRQAKRGAAKRLSTRAAALAKHNGVEAERFHHLAMVASELDRKLAASNAMLAAVTAEQGGSLRVSRAVLEGIEDPWDLESRTDKETGDFLITLYQGDGARARREEVAELAKREADVIRSFDAEDADGGFDLSDLLARPEGEGDAGDIAAYADAGKPISPGQLGIKVQ